MVEGLKEGDFIVILWVVLVGLLVVVGGVSYIGKDQLKKDSCALCEEQRKQILINLSIPREFNLSNIRYELNGG